MLKGKVYTITCEALGVPGTKQASYRAANSWWEAKVAEIAHSRKVRDQPFVLDIRRRLDWAAEKGREDLADHLRGQLAEAKILTNSTTGSPIESDEQQERISDQYITSPDLEERLRGLEDLGVKGLRNLTPIVLDKIIGDRRIWDDRLRQARRPVVSEEKSIKTLAGRWLDKEQARGTNGQLAPRALGNIRASLGHFIEFLGDDKGADYTVADPVLPSLQNDGWCSP